MKQQEAKQVLRELQQFGSRASAEIDTTYVRPDGKGYQVRVQWGNRVATLGRLNDWTALMQAWQALNERG